MSLSKALHLHCLVLVQPRKTSQHDLKIVDLDVEAQTKQSNMKLFTFRMIVSFLRCLSIKVNNGIFQTIRREKSAETV